MIERKPPRRVRDRDAQNAHWRRWYRANASTKIAWQKRRKDELRSWWRELKASRCCETCGERAPECLQFHHLDRSAKDLALGAAIAFGWSKKRILAEVAKCRVLCANCHLKHHWDDRQRTSR